MSLVVLAMEMVIKFICVMKSYLLNESHYCNAINSVTLLKSKLTIWESVWGWMGGWVGKIKKTTYSAQLKLKLGLSLANHGVKILSDIKTGHC